MRIAELETALAELVDEQAPPPAELDEARRRVQRRVRRHRRYVGITAAVTAAAATALVVGLVMRVDRPGAGELVAAGGGGPSSSVTTLSGNSSTSVEEGPKATGPGPGVAETTPVPPSTTIDAIYGQLPGNTGGKAALVHTGLSVVVYGGEDRTVGGVGPPIVGGWRYDVGVGQWKAIPAAPFQHDAQLPTSGAWTGEEVLVWNRFGAASYNPETETWRAHPNFPAGSPHAVWSGDRLKAWEQGVSYDPATGTSVPLPRPQRQPGAAAGEVTALWADAGIYVIEGRTVWRYDSGAADWYQLPSFASPGNASFTGAAWDGERLVVVGPDRAVAAYEPQRAAWVALSLAPLGPTECVMRAVGGSGRVYVDGCSGIAVLGPDGWETVIASGGQMLLASDALMVLRWAGGLAQHRLPLPDQVYFGGAVAAVPDGWELVSLEGRDNINSPTERLTSPTGPIWATPSAYVAAELRTRDGRLCTLLAQSSDYIGVGRAFRTTRAVPGGHVEASCDHEVDLANLLASVVG